MKTKIKVTAFLTFIAAAISFACAEQKTPPAAEKNFYKSAGIVTKTDAVAGKITIDHEDIPGYMAAMGMSFDVKDKNSLAAVKAGDKVEFELERAGANLLITNLKKTAESAVLNGAEIYKTNCAECHGARGEGAKKGIPLTSGHALHHTEAEHIKQVTDGEDEKMPAFKDKLSAAEIAAVVKFVREELQNSAARKNDHKHAH